MVSQTALDVVSPVPRLRSVWSRMVEYSAPLEVLLTTTSPGCGDTLAPICQPGSFTGGQTCRMGSERAKVPKKNCPRWPQDF